MAKEMMIVFLYDTQLLQREEDDPTSAILYFHPGWVSDQQRTSLCGQIIGTSHFLTSIFKGPRIYSLQTGKFVIRMYGRYLLAVGTDRNIENWVLEHRTNTLTSLITFFHCDFTKLSLYQESLNISAKLYFMFETYLKILMYGGHMFYNIPTIQLPKSSSHVFLETVQFLQWCQQFNYVLGGTVLYHNKVVATQLTPELTKQIVLTDPYRIKSPAESFSIDFTPPLGVQLLHVYISKHEYYSLVEDASVVRSGPPYSRVSSRKMSSKLREPILSAMKREQSIIFTTVPEEEPDEFVQLLNKKLPDRPSFLNLQEVIETPKMQSSLLLNHTSICSTPMTDLNKLIHQNIMSICVDPQEIVVKENLDNFSSSIEKKQVNVVNEHKTLIRKQCLTRHYSSILKSSCDDEIPNRNFQRFQSIADPLFPFFKANGKAISQWLFSKYLVEPITILEYKPRPLPHIKTDLIKKTPASRKSRKSLTLPLKSLTSDQTSEYPSRNGGVQLTPLMAKLSLLADDKSSGICTPNDYGDGRFTPSQSGYTVLEQQNITEDVKNKDLVEGVLLVCGQQDMVMTLLLEHGIRDSPEIVNQLWEKSTELLGRLQQQLRHSLETYHGSRQNDSAEPYSYICMDPQWDNVHRGGPWGGTDLGILTHLHHDFVSGGLTEIILRTEESIVYGHHCGQTEVFYQQATTSAAGLPTPADLMATVTLKAKRRLERDHAIILL